MKKLTVTLSDELYDEFASRAEKQGVSISEWLRRAVALQRFVEYEIDRESNQ